MAERFGIGFGGGRLAALLTTGRGERDGPGFGFDRAGQGARQTTLKLFKGPVSAAPGLGTCTVVPVRLPCRHLQADQTANSR